LTIREKAFTGKISCRGNDRLYFSIKVTAGYQALVVGISAAEILASHHEPEEKAVFPLSVRAIS
jgi:hypothetical protein